MIRRKLVWGLVWLGAACLLTFGCGNVISTTAPTADTGGLIILIGDTPLCDVLSFRSILTGMILRSQSEGIAANPFKGILQPFIKVNFSALRDLTSVLRVAPVTVGTYDQATVSLGSVTFAYYDPTKNLPVTFVTPTFSDTNPTLNIQPPITITKGTISALKLDFDVRRSISVDAQGHLTGASSAALSLAPVTANSTNGFGRLEDLKGYILSVTSGSTLSQFLGSINIQLHSGSSAVPQVAVNFTPETRFFTADSTDNVGFTATPQFIGTILGGSYVEVDGYIDSKGNLVANTVQIEDQENANTSHQALIGTITGITRDLAGNATQFNLFVSEEQPESAFNVALDSIVDVELLSATKYIYSSRPLNFASVPFDVTSMAVGQQVIVHGASTRGTTGNPTSVKADSVYLSLQSHEGNFSSLVSAASDDRTGAFWLQTCATLFHGSPMLVLTNSDTSFVNVTGLTGLTSQPTLIVKGLLFYELHGGTVNGVTVPPGTLLMLADEVHSLL
ncbi:MAG TPA: DUF4382 domain-containing protein [Terriglobia bacterium]|nr:DUF4382 domain-containing protein [Terriglobia bacterium]